MIVFTQNYDPHNTKDYFESFSVNITDTRAKLSRFQKSTYHE
jgi:hypothetical protein